MDPEAEHRVVSIDKVSGGLVVTFEDGRFAYYSAALLYSLLDQAEKMDESEWKE